MASKEDKLSVKGFKDGSSNYWCNNKHYALLEDNSVVFICGGNSDEKELEAVKNFCKRNKKQFKEREESIFDQEPIEWITISFGKFAGKKLDEIKGIDSRYCLWLYQNTTDNSLKEQLKILLKK